MWISHLKIFLDLAETKSFSLAAERNGLSQSAVSQQLPLLEHEFGSQLIERNKRKFQLTPAGELVIQHARKIVQTCNKLNSQMEVLKQIVSNTIRIAATPYIGLYSLPPYLQEFQTEHPQAIIQVKYCRTEQICEEVLECRADLGLVAHRIKEPQLECTPFH